MKKKWVVYLLWLVGFCGLLGFQHIYLDKYGKAIVWLFTGGVLGIGALVDLFTLGSAVDFYNLKQGYEASNRNKAE